MEHWDAQLMLDMYIHNYLKKNNMSTTAACFSREANIPPKDVAIDLPEGFLSEWWSIFWSVYSARFPKDNEEPEDALSMASNDVENVGYVPQIVPPVMPSSDTAYMLQNMCPTPQTMGHPNMLQNVGPMTMPSYQREKIYKNPQLSITRDGKSGATFWRSTGSVPTHNPSKAIQFKTQPVDIGSRMLEQEHRRLAFRNLSSTSQLLDVNQLASLLPSSSNFSYPHPPQAFQLVRESADTDARMYEQERLRLLTGNFGSNSGLINFAQLAPFLPSSINFNHPQKNKKRQLSVTGDINCGTSLRKSPAPKSMQNEMELANTDARTNDEGYLGTPVGDLNPNSQLLDVDQLALLFSSSSNCSHAQRNAYGKSQVSVCRDGKGGTSVRRCVAAQPSTHAPKAIQSNTEPAGSSTSSNSTRTDPSS